MASCRALQQIRVSSVVIRVIESRESERKFGMNPELWRRVEELFHAALDLSPDARPAFLEKACGEDAGLRHHVELLLSKDEHAGSLLEKPILADVMRQHENEDSFLPANVMNLASAGSTKPSRIGTRVGTYEFVSLL